MIVILSIASRRHLPIIHRHFHHPLHLIFVLPNQAALASSNASESASSPAVAPSSSRLRGRHSRSQRHLESASNSVAGEDVAALEPDAKAANLTASTGLKRKPDEASAKSKKRRSHRVD